MDLYLKQAEQSDVLFLVCDASGTVVFRVVGNRTPMSAKFSLIDDRRNEVAKITGMGASSLFKYTIEISGNRKKASLIHSLSGSTESFSMRNPGWRFRGGASLRSFDVIDVDRAAVMSHSAYWRPEGICWCVHIEEERNVLLCLSICAAIDSILPSGKEVAVPG